MANYAAGFRPVKSIIGAPYSGACNIYVVPGGETVSVGVGDLVKLSNSNAIGGYLAVETLAAASDVILGAVVGICMTVPDGSMTNGASPVLDTPVFIDGAVTGARYVYVADDPNLIFQTQASGTYTADQTGLNAQPTVTTVSTSTGSSTMKMDTTTLATTNTHGLVFLGVVQSPDNTLGAAGSAVLVKINRHAFANQVTGV